jgi:dipeptidyl aminopeptidase/acylaminoacyl peptidase
LKEIRMRFMLLALFLASAAVAQAPKHTITHEDMWRMKRVGQPAVSPDGLWVAFPVTEPAYDDKEVRRDLWLVRADGSAPARRLTNTKRAESDAQWSPDGSRLAFATRREDDEQDQIYVLDVHGGGEAQRVTEIETGAGSPKWRPDGKAILFVSEVFPGASDADNKKLAQQRKDRKYKARVYENAPIRFWDQWLEETRPALFVQTLGEPGKARNLFAGSQFAQQAGFGGQLSDDGDDLDAAWTPDGSGVVFAATVNRNEWTRASNIVALWLISADGGEPKRLTGDNGTYDSPTFSPDGRALYATLEPLNDKVYNIERLVRWSWSRGAAEIGEPRAITAGFDRSVGDFVVAPDSARVYLLAEDQGHEKLYRVSAIGGAVSEVGKLESGCFTGLVGGAKGNRPVLIANWESSVSPNDVGVIDSGSGRWRALSKLHAERTAAIDWQPVQEFRFKSSRGAQIHNFIALPPNFDPARKYPLFVVIHGGPHSMWRDQFVIRWNYHLLASQGYVVLLTNYSGSTGFGEAFAQAIQGDPLKGPAMELNEAADEAIRRYPFIDASKQAAGGASYGGHLTNWLAVSTTRYKALVSHAGLFDLKTQWTTSDVSYDRERSVGGPFWEGAALWREQSPLTFASKLETPMLVTVGEKDYRVPMNNTFELWTALQRQNVPSRLIVFPEANHWIMKGEDSRFFYSELQAWLAKYLQ